MENSPYIELRRKRSFGEKVNVTFEFLRQNFKSLFKSVILISGAPILLVSLFISSFYSTLMNRVVALQTNPELLTEFFSPTFFIGIFGMMLFALVAYTTTVAVVNNFLLEYESTHGGPVTVQAVWKRVSQSLPGYLGMTVLVILFIIIACCIVFLPGGILLTASPGFGALLLFVGFFFYMFIVVKLMPIYCVKTFESVGFVDAVRRSFYLTNGKWWSTLGIVMILSLIQTFISYIFMIPGYVIVGIKAVHTVTTGSTQNPMADLGFAYQVIMMIFYVANLILYSLPLLGIAFQYFNLVELKEAPGLMNKISQIGESPGSSATHEDF